MALIRQVQNRITELEIPGYGEDEVGFMAETIWLVEPDFLFEWGTNRGSSARIFYEAAEIIGCGTCIHTTELPDELASLSTEHAGAETGKFISDLDVIDCHRGDGVTESLFQYKRLGRDDSAVFFLDGDHSYGNVLRELSWIYRLADQCVILMHDMNAPAVRTAIQTFAHSPLYKIDWLNSDAGMARLVPK